VADNCRRLGITIMHELAADGRIVQLDRLADRVLVDAPCSGLGVLGRRSDARWHKAEEDIARLQALQLELLQHAATLLRPGGRLVYSTCTVEPEEDEAVVAAFLRANAEEWQLEAPQGIPTALIDAHGYYRTWPHRHDIGGAFGAAMVRRA
jgi:16S rRNA (cytosine967-C5)-methyltransferase